jgi:hypothetical protein
LQRVRGTGRRIVAPDRVDESVGEHRATRVEREPDQQGTQACATDIEFGAMLVSDEQRAEDRDTHVPRMSARDLLEPGGHHL